MSILLDEASISKWAYKYCRDVNDNPEIRKNITDSGWAYCYCKVIKDDPEVRKNITKQYWGWLYYKNINDKPEIRKKYNLTEYVSNVIDFIINMNLELLDDEYKGVKYEHNFRCFNCKTEFKDKYVNLKRRKTICPACLSYNLMYMK